MSKTETNRQTVLRAIKALLVQAPEAPFYGYQIMQLTGLPHNDVRPATDWMVSNGYVTFTWDVEDPRPGGRRKLFTLTETGRQLVASVA